LPEAAVLAVVAALGALATVAAGLVLLTGRVTLLALTGRTAGVLAGLVVAPIDPVVVALKA
jgi:hypothetical protein